MNQKAIALYAAEEHWQTILESPEYFLHGMDVVNETFEFVTASRQSISSASFLDGRTPLSADQRSYYLPMQDVLDWHQHSASNTDTNRFIFHMSFCGSTLLARALDQQQSSVTLREPQILLELAELKAAQSEIFRNKTQWRKLMKLVLSQHAKEWSRGERIVIKPSNWANSMLPEMVSDGGPSRAIFLGISPLAFLTAVFRGGGERIQFTYAVLKHLATAFPEFDALISEVESAHLSTPDTFSRLTLIVHAIQCKAFNRVARTNSMQAMYAFNFEEFLSAPQEHILKSASALDLTYSESQLTATLERTMNHHSKITERGFNAKNANKVDEQVKNTYGKNFASALGWAEQNLDLAHFK